MAKHSCMDHNNNEDKQNVMQNALVTILIYKINRIQHTNDMKKYLLCKAGMGHVIHFHIY
jgi:hypothetical protein